MDGKSLFKNRARRVTPTHPATQPQTPDWGVHRLLKVRRSTRDARVDANTRTGIKPASGPQLCSHAPNATVHALAGPEFLTQLARQRHFGDQPRLKRLKCLSAFPMGIQNRGARPPARPCWRRALRAATRLDREAQAASVGRPRLDRATRVDRRATARAVAATYSASSSAATLTINSFCVASPIASRTSPCFTYRPVSAARSRVTTMPAAVARTCQRSRRVAIEFLPTARRERLAWPAATVLNQLMLLQMQPGLNGGLFSLRVQLLPLAG